MAGATARDATVFDGRNRPCHHQQPGSEDHDDLSVPVRDQRRQEAAPRADDLPKLRAIEDCTPEDYLTRVARVRKHLEAGRHEPWSRGLFWLKPGEHTRDRYLVSVEGWRLLVRRMVEHKEYDKLLTENRQRDVGARVVAERRARYAPFVRMEL